MKKTSWLRHVEFEKPIEFSRRVNQIFRFLGTYFQNWQRNVQRKIKRKVDSRQERRWEAVYCRGDKAGLGVLLGGRFEYLGTGKRNFSRELILKNLSDNFLSRTLKIKKQNRYRYDILHYLGLLHSKIK